jgi:hypothetical protein
MTPKPKDAGWEYLLELVPFYFVARDIEPGYEVNKRPALQMEHADKDQQKLFYKAMLKLPWLNPDVRRAVAGALGLSLQKQNRKIEEARTITLKAMLAEIEARMRNNPEQPQGGVHNAALAELAARVGMDVETVTKRFYRLKRSSNLGRTK